MKYFEKQLTGFCITYLHNPFECEKCRVLEKVDENFGESFSNYCCQKSKTLKLNHVNEGVPLNNLVPKIQTISKDTDFLTPFPFTNTPLTSKKKSFSDIHSESGQCPTPLKKINKIKSTPKSSKKTSTEKYEKINTVKKQATKSMQKPNGDKIPGKGTLKRKRWFIEQLQQKNDNYEDDLFEDQKFGHFRNLLEDESDSPENYIGLKTPIFPFSLSPRECTPSPEYTDCYSAEQLSLSRKRGEEYQYRLKKRRKLDFPTEKKEPETPQATHEGQSETILERLLQVEKILNSHIAKAEKSDTEEDQYFSDVLK